MPGARIAGRSRAGGGGVCQGAACQREGEGQCFVVLRLLVEQREGMASHDRDQRPPRPTGARDCDTSISRFRYGIDTLLQSLRRRFSPLLGLAWRTVFRLGFPLARIWWRLSHAQHQGALVAITVGPDLLLVRSSYRDEWNFPGGGVKAGETPEAAARREIAEEIGVSSPALIPAGIVCGRWDGRRDRVHFFRLQLDRLPTLQPDNREIIEARLMSPAELDSVALTGPVAAYIGRKPAGANPGSLQGSREMLPDGRQLEFSLNYA
jgi:8-oxo-dGTP diphosphatase